MRLQDTYPGGYLSDSTLYPDTTAPLTNHAVGDLTIHRSSDSDLSRLITFSFPVRVRGMVSPRNVFFVVNPMVCRPPFLLQMHRLCNVTDLKVVKSNLRHQGSLYPIHGTPLFTRRGAL